MQPEAGTSPTGGRRGRCDVTEVSGEGPTVFESQTDAMLSAKTRHSLPRATPSGSTSGRDTPQRSRS